MRYADAVVRTIDYAVFGRKDPLCQESKTEKGRSKVSVSTAASGVVVQVYPTGQGQDERARPRPAHLLRGLDSAWSESSNPHRESGTRCRAAADVGVTGTSAGTAHGRQSRRIGNRLGDSVGAHSPRTREGPRSAEPTQWGVMGRRDLDSGDVLPRCMSQPRRFKRYSLIVGLALPHAIDDAHPHVGQGAHGHAVAFPASRSLALVVGQRPGFLPRRLPGKLVQDVAQWLHTGEAFVRFGVIAALEWHGCGSGQRLDTCGIGVATAIIAPFSQQTGSQVLARARQRPPQLLIVMAQKKGADGLVEAFDLLDEDQQLFDQLQHQP